MYLVIIANEENLNAFQGLNKGFNEWMEKKLIKTRNIPNILYIQ